MTQVPAAILAYHRSGAPLEGDLPGSLPGRYQLWAIADIDELNRSYAVDKFAPGYLGIGSNGGGEMIALSPRGEVVAIPFVGMAPEESVVLAESWQVFESRIKSGGA